MKKIQYIIAISIASLFSYSAAIAQESSNCDATALKAELKAELKPDYKYDSSKITRYTASADFQGQEIEVPLFPGEKYRFVFNIAGTGKNFQVYVYDKKAGTSNRKALFALKSVKEEGKNVYTFEPDGKSTKLYITYVIPPSLEGAADGCVAFMLGYKF